MVSEGGEGQDLPAPVLKARGRMVVSAIKTDMNNTDEPTANPETEEIEEQEGTEEQEEKEEIWKS